MFLGVVYHHGSLLLEAQRHPPIGRLVDIGGRKLHLDCRGKGTPVVVMISGLPGFSLDWSKVHNTLARSTQTCAYDRAGYGWSESFDSGHPKRNIASLVKELRVLLKAAKIKPPFLLLAHSFGGLIAQEFAARFKNNIAAMVLVDSSHPAQGMYFREICKTSNAQCLEAKQKLNSMLRFCDAVAPLGIMRLLAALGLFTTSVPYPGVIKQQVLQFMLRSPFCRSLNAEVTSFLEETSEPAAKAKSLGNIPLTVITRNIYRARSLGIFKNIPLALYEVTWKHLQLDLARLSSRSEHLTAKHAGHNIHLEESELVIKAVIKRLNQLRSPEGS